MIKEGIIKSIEYDDKLCTIKYMVIVENNKELYVTKKSPYTYVKNQKIRLITFRNFIVDEINSKIISILSYLILVCILSCITYYYFLWENVQIFLSIGLLTITYILSYRSFQSLRINLNLWKNGKISEGTILKKETLDEDTDQGSKYVYTITFNNEETDERVTFQTRSQSNLKLNPYQKINIIHHREIPNFAEIHRKGILFVEFYIYFLVILIGSIVLFIAISQLSL